jgi:DNA (cytosine-5)-methyltransferase 1
MTYGSLFSGIGGIDLGLDRAGFDCRWQVEYDPFCQQILSKHWPNVPKYPDITTLDPTNLEHVDLIAGGFPCQDISNASHTATGLAGERSGLWWKMLQTIRMVRPKYVLVENVAAILKRGVDQVLGSLAEAGYDTEWDCLPASQFGAPHIRNRWFALAYTNQIDGGKGVGMFKNGSSAVFTGSDRQRTELWIQAPDCPRGMDDGIPGRIYASRVGALGNAVCPPLANWLGQHILQHVST